LYTSLIVLKGKLAKPLFQHFMLFHCAIKILISNNLYTTHNTIAKNLLISFVSQYPTLYGYEYVTYNVHGLSSWLTSHFNRVLLTSLVHLNMKTVYK